MANIRTTYTGGESNLGTVNYGTNINTRAGNFSNGCISHKTRDHSTEECRHFISKSPQERMDLLIEYRASWCCMKIGHMSRDCRNKRMCKVDSCKMYHHPLLHGAEVTATVYTVNSTSNGSNNVSSTTCLLPVMKVNSISGILSVLWDSGASISLITFEKARELKLKGKRVELSVAKVGGQIEKMSSFMYTLPLIDKGNRVVTINVYGIEKISRVHQGDITSLMQIFKGVPINDIQRPRGEINVLVGFNYASIHPHKIRAGGNLILMENRFGKCIAGSHHKIKESHEIVVDSIEICHIAVDEESFLNVEQMGVQCFPLCGNCSCQKCALGSKGLSIKEEREQALINEGLSYNESDCCCVAVYPWIKDPKGLPDNYSMAIRRLENTERRLLRNPSHSKIYDDQIVDMFNRNVARILTQEEIDSYNGPYYYLCHHEVLKAGSSTPCRIVFDSSAKFMNQCLNDYWAKGAKLVNNLVGILLRFRENKIATSGDIKKMYHAVKISLLDQHIHRFLWRNLKVDCKPDVYVMTSVSFGDKPAGNIAMAAFHKTAEYAKQIYPEAASTILRNTHVDDVIDSFGDAATAEKVMKEIDELIKRGGFAIKGWVTSDSKSIDETEYTKILLKEDHKVLGMVWERSADEFKYHIKLNLCSKRKLNPKLGLRNPEIPEILTKRMILSQMNSIFDPLGLIAPFTIKAKFLMKNLWKQKLGWDDKILGVDKINIVSFLNEMPEVENISFKRCLKPEGAVGNPVLVTFSDASNDALSLLLLEVEIRKRVLCISTSCIKESSCSIESSINSAVRTLWCSYR